MQAFLQRLASLLEPALIFLDPGQSLQGQRGTQPALGQCLQQPGSEIVAVMLVERRQDREDVRLRQIACG